MRAKAIDVLRKCLEFKPGDKDIHYRLAKYLREESESDGEDILYHLRRSFTQGDTRYESQFWYAREAFIAGDFEKAADTFRRLKRVDKTQVNPRTVRGEIFGGDSFQRFSGRVVKKEYSYAFLARDGDQIEIYAPKNYSTEIDWSSISANSRITFAVAFNYLGPVAIELKPEK